jgi:hypothetical protein
MFLLHNSSCASTYLAFNIYDKMRIFEVMRIENIFERKAADLEQQNCDYDN